MAKVMAGDVARSLDVLGLVNGHAPDDWLDARDPEYIRDALPAIRAWSDVYFRAEVDGLEEIPADEPVLLVGNHSGGTLIADTFVFSQHFYDHFGAERRFHQLAHDLVFQVPGVRASLSRFGTVPASPDNMRAALDRGAALLVYPGRRPRDLPADLGAGPDRLRRAHRLRQARARARHPDRARGGDRRPGDGAVPRPGRPVLARAAARQGAAAEGVPGPGGAAVRPDAARPAAAVPAPVQDQDPRAPGDRPARRAGRRRRTPRTPTSS